MGTLVVNLPSKHEGGELVVRFDGREEVIDFSKAGSYKFSYAAFFADCEHELRKVTSGYRVCLVYNLLLANAPKLMKTQSGKHVDEMVTILQGMASIVSAELPKAVLLDHEYTQSNFSASALKLNDLPRVEALLEAAEKADYFAKLALMTHYQMGSCEPDGYYDYYNQHGTNEEGGSMGEIYEEYTQIEHWDKAGIPDLGEITIDQDNIITNIETGVGDPSEEEFEGYTGNAGMTMEYWYHYGAVILWPKNKHIELLRKRPVDVRLRWMDYFLNNWDDSHSSRKYLWAANARGIYRRRFKKETY